MSNEYYNGFAMGFAMVMGVALFVVLLCAVKPKRSRRLG
jgi:hypothetical protein